MAEEEEKQNSEVEEKSLTKKSKEKTKKLWEDFKAFINRGSVVDMAVGVIMGSAFGAIVTAFTNILLSLCTWGVPGGINGLITVLPAVNESQAGITGIGQKFDNSQLSDMAKIYAESMGAKYEGNEATWISTLKGLYTQHGDTWTYNQSSIIDWGTFINAIISFLVIAITLFTILKIYNSLKNKRIAAEEKLKEAIEHKEEVKEDK